MPLDPTIYNDPAPRWKERAARSAMTENSWDTTADADLSDRIELGTATVEEMTYMVAKYGDDWDLEEEGTLDGLLAVQAAIQQDLAGGPAAEEASTLRRHLAELTTRIERRKQGGAIGGEATEGMRV